MTINRPAAQWRAWVAVTVTTLLLTLDAYHVFLGSQQLTRLVLYLIAPLAIILLIFRESPARYGFRLGNWRAGLRWTFVGWVGAGVVAILVGQTASFQAYYGPAATPSAWLEAGIELLGWEFFFRGFLLFSLYRACGPLAWILQAVPFALAHIGKPELETLSCIFGGTFFGYVAWRSRSFLYPFLIHWFLVVAITTAAR